MAVDGGETRRAGSGYLVAGRYRLLRKIGAGGMGAVWLANDQLLGREVAVKQVLSTAGLDPAQAAEQRQRFLREGRIAARLTHPHAIAMYDVALESGEPWLVMEYLPSRSLATVLNTSGTLPVRQVAQIGAQLADALAAAHAAGVVHRDVKPGNVLIADAGRSEGIVKITDFGISRAHGDITLTKTGIINGTPAYLSPEVARGHETTEASDVFALASTLFTAVEGVPPFGSDDNAMALLHRVAGGEVTHPIRAGAITPILLWMLEPEPSRRPTMTQARDELAHVAAGRGGDTRSVLTARTPLPFGNPAPGSPRTAAYAPDADEGQAVRTGSRPSRLAWVAAGVVLLILATVAAAVALTSGGGTPEAGPAPTPSTATALAPSSVPTTSAPTTTAPTTTVPTTTPTQPSASTTTTSTTTTTPSSTPVAVSADSAVSAVRNYYSLLPGDTSTAWDRLGPTLRAQGFNSYDNFWSGFKKVTLLSASSEDDGATVTVRLQFDRDKGPKVVETHRLTMLSRGSAPPLIDSDTLLS